MIVENNYVINDTEIRVVLNLRITHNNAEFYVSRKPDQLNHFLNEELKDVEQLMCDEFLLKQGFYKREDGRWNERNKKLDYIRIPECFFKEDGRLRVQFGEIYSHLDFSDGIMSSLEDLPIKIFTTKETYNKKKHRPGQITLTKSINGQSTEILNVSYKEIHDYLYHAIKIPEYEFLKEKFDRWFSGQFDYLGIRSVEIGMFNWYIEQVPESKLKLYERFFDELKIIIDKNLLEQIPKFKYPTGFLEWLYSDKDGEVVNTVKSILSIKKFML